MKRLIFLFIPLAIWAYKIPAQSPNPKVINAFPYEQSFANPFNSGKYFYEEWFGNKAPALIRQHTEFGKTDSYSLEMTPEGEELPTFAVVKLDLTGKSHTFVRFWAASRKNGSEEDLKRTKLSVSVSLDGGSTYGFGHRFGAHQGLENADTGFEEFTYPLPPAAAGLSAVFVKFTVKAGGGPHKPAIVLIDDVYIGQEASDVFPPLMVGEVDAQSYSLVNLHFNEPLDLVTAQNVKNYDFHWPEENANLNPPGSAVLPKVKQALLTEEGYTLSLFLQPPLTQGAYYGLTIDEVCDLSANCTPLELELVYNILPYGALTFSEVFFADPGQAHPKFKLQFVELHNPTNQPVPIGGLRIKGAISAHNMPNVKIPPGGFHVITRNDESFLSTFGFPAWEWKGSWIEYGNSHEEKELEEQELYIQTTQHHSPLYVDHMVFHLGEQPWEEKLELGFSVEKICLTSSSMDPGNWALANGLGTPPAYTYVFNGTSYTITATPGKGRSNEVPCGNNGEKIQICHTTGNGNQILCIDPVSLADHLAHGDWIGWCEGDCGGPAKPGRLEANVPEVVIAPNPFYKTTYIATSPEFGPITGIELRALSGQLVLSYKSLNTRNFELDRGDLAPGVYILHVEGVQNRVVKKLVVQ